MNSLGFNVLTGIVKQYHKRSIVLMLALTCVFVLCGCSSSSDSHEKYSQLSLDISSDDNMLFNKYAITVSLDGTEIGSVENGEEFVHSLEVVQGEHILEFCKSGSKKPKCEKTITVTEDTLYSCKLNHSGFAIKIVDESLDTVVSETTGKDVETSETTGKDVETSETTESSVIESAETVGIAPVAVIETENTTIESTTVETTVTETVPTVVSDNITEISFVKNEDIELVVGCARFSGSVSVKAKDEKSISSSNVIFVSENPEIAEIKCMGMMSKEILYAYMLNAQSVL